jgi:hypothetical protein
MLKMCRNNQCDYVSLLERTLTYRRAPKKKIRYARLWEEIELPKALGITTPEQYEKYLEERNKE